MSDRCSLKVQVGSDPFSCLCSFVFSLLSLVVCSIGYGVGLPLPCASTGHWGRSLLNSLVGLASLAELGGDNALTCCGFASCMRRNALLGLPGCHLSFPVIVNASSRMRSRIGPPADDIGGVRPDDPLLCGLKRTITSQYDCRRSWNLLFGVEWWCDGRERIRAVKWLPCDQFLHFNFNHLCPASYPPLV